MKPEARFPEEAELWISISGLVAGWLAEPATEFKKREYLKADFRGLLGTLVRICQERLE